MLIIHIIIAFSSLVAGVAGVISPSNKRLKFAVISSLFTIATGIGLVFAGYSALHVCMAGIAFTAAATGMIAIGYRRLALSNQ